MPERNNDFDEGWEDKYVSDVWSEKDLRQYALWLIESYPGYSAEVMEVLSEEGLSIMGRQEILLGISEVAREHEEDIRATIVPEWRSISAWEPANPTPTIFDILQQLAEEDELSNSPVASGKAEPSNRVKRFWSITHSLDRRLKIGATTVLKVMRRID